MFFFFQAEDGIRDLTVTGVQTCALPISALRGPLGRNTPDEPQIVKEQWMIGVFREPVADGLRVAGRRLAGQIAVQQEIEALFVGVHAPITGQGRPDPQAYAAFRALPRRITRTPPAAGRGTAPTPPRPRPPGTRSRAVPSRTTGIPCRTARHR